MAGRDHIDGAGARSYEIVSLFSGCGGMDLGFMGGFQFGGSRYPRHPFTIAWANDNSRPACATYQLNLKHAVIEGDIDTSLDSLPNNTDVVIGGFPCQDVSINGIHQVENGSRTVLYRQMIEVILRVRPRIFVAENVKGLLQSHGRRLFDMMMNDFRSTEYTVNHHLYRASDYGVPQVRERVFIVGTDDGREFTHPEPCFTIPVTAREALLDLESLAEDRSFAHIWSKAARSPEQGNRQLNGAKPSTTIRAEHHGNSQFHYRLPRRISLREAARLQSFPDGYQFPAGMRETERQIGNAVPPVLAWHIADAVRKHLGAK